MVHGKILDKCDMETSRTKTKLRRVYVLPISKQIGVLEEFTTRFEGEIVDVQGIDRFINPGDDLSGEDDLIRLIASTYFDTL
jgi:hypothetical protein